MCIRDVLEKHTHEMFIAFVLYEYQGAHDATFFFVGVSVGRAEHSLAGPVQSKAAACAWIETQTTISQAAAIP